MRSGSESEQEVAKAFLQLDFYLKTLQLPFTVKDLYRRAYQKRLGDDYNDRWIDWLAGDPKYEGALHEPFTAYTIIQTLKKHGHEPVIYALYRLTRRMEIGYSHAYVIGIAQE